MILTIDKRGVTPKKLSSDWCSSGYRVLSANNVKTSGLKKLEDIRFVDKETYQKWMKEEIQRGDVLLTSEAPAGEVFYWDSDEKIVVGQRLFGLRTKNDVDPLYLKYFLQSTAGQAEISNKCSGSTVFGISAKMFDQIKVILPESISYQKRVSSFLYAIDKKIENNNKINAELESLAKTIYDYWFLQFEFPNEEGKPYKSSGGKMVWNEELKREIPEGWNVFSLEERGYLKNGINYDKKDKGDKIFRIINVRDISQSSLFISSSSLENISLFEKSACNYKLDKNDILIARSGCPGQVRLIDQIAEDIIYCGFIICFSPKIPSERLYLTMALKKLEGTNASKTGGSILQNVSQATLKNIKICMPTNKLLDKYNSINSSINQKIISIVQENSELSSLRDFLLPMLMNGQITFR